MVPLVVVTVVSVVATTRITAQASKGGKTHNGGSPFGANAPTAEARIKSTKTQTVNQPTLKKGIGGGFLNAKISRPI